MLYMLFNAQQQLLSQSSVIWWILVQGVVVAVLMSLLWGQTASVFGERHSLGRLVLLLAEPVECELTVAVIICL